VSTTGNGGQREKTRYDELKERREKKEKRARDEGLVV